MSTTTEATEPTATVTPQELSILRLLADGLPVDAVGRRLNMSERTVRRRTKAVCDRLGKRYAVQAIVWAARRGLL